MKPTANQLREHYEVEKELANKLRYATKEERKFLYTTAYNELYQRVPFHPQLIQKSSSEITDAYALRQMNFLNRFLNRKITFLEVGPGDCALSLKVAETVRQVYAVDVSDEITKNIVSPPNFKLFLSDGSSIPLPDASVDLAYSYMLMEHLHPEDAFDQLKNIWKALVKGGKYICITPNRSNGPHDISKYFDSVATGFHLKEYTVHELSELLLQAGFSKVKACVGGRSLYLVIPVYPWTLMEKFMHIFPRSLRKTKLLRQFLQNRLIGIK